MTNEYLHNVLPKYKTVLENAIRLDIYRFQRYDVPFSMATFYSDKEIDIERIMPLVRQTDTVVELNSSLVCVIYGNIGYAEAFKAAENMLYQLNSINPSLKVSAGMTSIKASDLPKDLLQRVFQNLEQANTMPESYVGDDYIIDYMIGNGFQAVG